MASKRKRVQQRYKVNMYMQAWDLAKAGVALTIEVNRREGRVGTIEIGQGSFRWKKAYGKSGFKPIRWDRLAELLNEMT